ncbi:MAG: phage tail tape measure protein [Clostridia bacterium]|nr:phage tail tape measure protein [Clostridia bacterium]
MADDLKRVGLIFKADGSVDFRKSLQEVNLELNKNYNQFKLTQAQWDKTTSSTEKLRVQQEYLKNAFEYQSDRVNILRRELAELEGTENKNVTAIKKKRNELTQAEVKLKNYENRLKEVEKSLTSFGKKLEETGEKIEKAGKKTEEAGKKFSAFSAASTAALIYAGKSAIDFEDAFTGVEKTVDGTEEQMQKLKQGIRDMAKEIPSTTTEISAVAEAAGQLGIETDNILGFTRTMIDLGNATNLTAEQAASQLAKFANIMGMSQKDFDKLGSTIVDLGNHFATTEADIVEMAMRLAGAGKQVGLSEGQVLGLATALSSVGIEAEMGGSAISKAMVKMQNAVELSNTKLQDVINKTGKSLHELQLMSTNDTKGFKELAGSLDMTTTQLKNIVNAGVDLENFAKISGKTTDEFKKQWKEDAAGALSDFIKGLGDAESKGDSAVTMLTEMGLTEVRLRDAILRAANAGDLFNTAIDRGTKAWEDNTALTNEANKRYETVKSKIIIATNKLKDLAITVGNKLLPQIDKGIGFIEKVTKKVEKLNDNQVDTIIKIGKIVAVAGPLLTIMGKFISTGGKVIKGVGTFTQAVGVMKGTVVSSSESVNSLAGFLTKLTSPAGLATAAVLAAAGAVIYLSTKQSEETKVAQKFAEEMSNTKKELDEYNKGIDDAANAELSRINYVEKLTDELKTLADENGKVQEKDKGRVSFILNEMNEALGTEYKLNGDIIQSYKELQSEIDSTITKKKAEIKLNAKKEKYENAIKNQDEGIENLRKANEELEKTGMSYDELQKKVDRYWTVMNDWKKNPAKYQTVEYNRMGKAIIKTDPEVESYISQEDYYNRLTATKNARDDALKVVKEFTSEVKDYEKDYADFVEGNYENIANTIIVTTEDWAKKSLDEIKDSIGTQSNYLKQYKDIYNETGNEVAYQNVKQAEQNMRDLAQNLADRTQTLESLGPTETEAWKKLADNNYNVYQEQLAKMKPEMQQKIADVTGVIYEKTPDVSQATQFMSDNIISKLDNDEEFRNEALSSMYSYLNGLSNSELRALLESAGVQDVNKVMEGIRNGNLAEEEGKNILTRLNAGLSSNAFQGSLFKTASSIAQGIASRLSVKFNIGGVSEAFKSITGLLPGHKSGLDYVPKDNYVARLHEGERVLTKQENKEYTEAEEEAKKHKSSVNIFSGSSDPSLLEAILASNNKVAALLEKLINVSGRKQQIVLDSGVLVGETIEDIDEELGRLEDKRRRGS